MDSINAYQLLNVLLQMNIGSRISASDINDFIDVAMCKGLTTELEYDDFELMSLEYPVELEVNRASILIKNNCALQDKLKHRLRFVMNNEKYVQIRSIWDEKNS